MRHALDLVAGRAIGKGSDRPDSRVWIPPVDGRWLAKPRLTQPDPDVQALLKQTAALLAVGRTAAVAREIVEDADENDEG